MRSARLVGAAETSEARAEWRRLQRKNLNIMGLLKRKEWPQCHGETSHQSRPCQEEKEQSRQSRVPIHEGEDRVKVGERRTLAREWGIRTGAWRGGKDRLHSEGRQILRRKGRTCKESLPKRGRRKHERVRTQKLSRKICRVLVSLLVWSNLK